MLKFYGKKNKVVSSWSSYTLGGEGASRPSYLIFVNKTVKTDEAAVLCVGLRFPQFNFKRSRKSSRNSVWLGATERYQNVIFISLQSVVMTWWERELWSGTEVTYFWVLKRCAVPQLASKVLICRSYCGEIAEYVKNQDCDWENLFLNQSNVHNWRATGSKRVNFEWNYIKNACVFYMKYGLYINNYQHGEVLNSEIMYII